MYACLKNIVPLEVKRQLHKTIVSDNGSPLSSSSAIFEPEVTIRKLFKCCSVDQDCTGCAIPPQYNAMSISPAVATGYISTAKCQSAATTIKGLFATKKNCNSSAVQYHCTYCVFACTWKYDLKLHLKQKHGIHKKN